MKQTRILLFCCIWALPLLATAQDLPRWSFETRIDQLDSEWITTHQASSPEADGMPVIIIRPTDERGWLEAWMVFSTFDDIPQLKVGAGGSSEKIGNHGWNQRLDSQFYLCSWYYDQHKLGQNWILREELGFQFYMEPWSNLGLVINQIWLSRQNSFLELGPVVIAEYTPNREYSSYGVKAQYQVNDLIAVQAAKLWSNNDQGLNWRFGLTLDF